MELKWCKIKEERYWDMLCVLPPAIMTGHGFLLGEPYDHDAEGNPRFSPFVEFNGEHYCADLGVMTIAEFKALDPAAVALAAQERASAK